jgi:hypothetical protein
MVNLQRYEQQMRQEAAVRYRTAAETAKKVVLDCRAKRLSGELKTHKASADCSNPILIQAYEDAVFPHMDLIRLMAAARAVGAEKIDRGEITEAESQLQLTELETRVRNEIQRRELAVANARSQAATAAAAQSQAAAAHSQAAAANTANLLLGLSALQASSAPRPIGSHPISPPVITNCRYIGATLNCVSQ